MSFFNVILCIFRFPLCSPFFFFFCAGTACMLVFVSRCKPEPRRRMNYGSDLRPNPPFSCCTNRRPGDKDHAPSAQCIVGGETIKETAAINENKHPWPGCWVMGVGGWEVKKKKIQLDLTPPKKNAAKSLHTFLNSEERQTTGWGGQHLLYIYKKAPSHVGYCT